MTQKAAQAAAAALKKSHESKPAKPVPRGARMGTKPTDPLTAGVIALAVLATIGAFYVGKEVVMPVALAIVLKLLLQPIVHFLSARLRVPITVAAFLLICGLFAAIAGVAFTISGPASGWIQKVPEVLPTVKEKLSALKQPIEYVQSAFKQIQEVASPGGNDNAQAVAVKDQSEVASMLALGTLTVLSRLLSTMVILFFLLAAGDRLLKGLIDVLPTFSDKNKALDIAGEIQSQIGGYLVTITIMNIVVGFVTGLSMWALGLGDPTLWGSIAFLLNYVPILGPLTGIGLFLVTGIVALDWPWMALLPALVYTLIHIAEGEIITPMLLAKRFTLNPVMVIVSLFFWDALWGIPGALLAVPMLAMFKIVCDRVEPLKPAGHIIGA